MLTNEITISKQYENYYLNDYEIFEQLQNAAKQTAKANETFYRKILSFVHFSAAAGQIKIEATNSTRALIYTKKIEKNVNFDELISADSIKNHARDASKKLRIIENKKGTGAYPNLARFISGIEKDSTIKAQYTAGELLPLLKGFKAAKNNFYRDFSNYIVIPDKNAVTMKLENAYYYYQNNKVTRGAININHSFINYGLTIPCEISGLKKEFSIHFKLDNLLEAAKSFNKSDAITMLLAKPLRPIMLTNNNGLYLIVSPIKINY